jgi:anti-sigma B factor antagonist
MEPTGIHEIAAQSHTIFIIRLEGEFDIADADRLTDAFAVANSAPLVIVDLEKTDYIDSTVLERLIVLHQTTQGRGAKLVLVGMKSGVRRLFEVTELHRIFTIHDSVRDVADVSHAEVRRLTIEGRPVD